MRQPRTALRPGRPRHGPAALAVVATLLLPSALDPRGSLFAGEPTVAHSQWLALVCGQGDVAAAPSPDASHPRQLLNQFLFRDREQQVALKKAQDELDAGDIVTGLQQLQDLIAQPHDAFLWNESRTQAVGAHVEAARVLESLDRGALASYERLYGPEAGRLLEAAKKSGEPGLCAEVVRRYYHTDAGFQAVNLQASRWFDRGQFRRASRTWDQLVANPVHKNRITPAIRYKATLARQLSDSSSPADNVLARAGERTAELERDGVVPTEYVVRRYGSQETADPQAAETDVSIPPAPSQPDARYSPSSPWLKPLWMAPLVHGPSDLLEVAYRNWEKHREEQSLPIASANHAIVVDGRLVVRDFQSIHAYDVESGESIWSYRCATSVASAADDLIRLYGRAAAGRAGSLVDFHAGNSVLGTLTGDGHRIYAIDYVEMATAGSNESTSSSARAAAGKTSRLVSREANRLVALGLESTGNVDSERKPVWSVGGPVGAPNWFHRMDEDDDGRVAPDEFVGSAEQFGAIDSNADGMLDRSEARGIGEQRKSDGELAGHFFLGPPLPACGRLYAVTESQRQLSLVALNPATGALLWSQGIGFVDRQIDVDAGRYPLACTPSYVDGIVLCPTQLGFLVAADAETGTLLWAHDTSDEPFYADGWSSTRQSYGTQGFPSVPLILGHCAVVMPQQSLRVHCFDVWSGRPLWEASREDGEFLAATDRNSVLVVGRQYCRGLSLENGEELWSSRVGTPCGVGAKSGPNYLLPLQEGRIATIEIGTGRQIGHTSASQALVETSRFADENAPAEKWRPGNLVAGDEIVVSVGSRQMVAFPQSMPLLKETYAELESNPYSAEHRLLAGELELVLGRLPAAHAHLSEVLEAPLNDNDRERAEQLLREQLYLELNAEIGDPQAILEQIERLSHSPRDRGRYLIQRAETQLQAGEFTGVLEATGEFARLNLDDLLPSADNEQHLVTASSWIPSVIERVRTKFGPEELEAVHDHVDALQHAALDAGDIEPLEHFLSIYGRWPQAAPVRTRLARLFVENGRYQAAELLLLQNRRNDDPAVAATATRDLAELWDRTGLAEEAASLLAELAEKFGDVVLDDGCTGRRFVAELPQNSLTSLAFQRMMSSEIPATSVRISETRWLETNPEFSDVFDRFRRRLIMPQGSTFQLLDRSVQPTQNSVADGRNLPGIGSHRLGLGKLLLDAYATKFQSSPESGGADGRLTVIDMQAGSIAGDVVVPSNNSFRQGAARNNDHGHFFPLGSPAKMHGISLLAHQSGEPLWSTRAQGVGAQRNAMRVGPYGPSFCTFQAGRHLVVADPATGKVRWQRGDLDPSSGLHDNSYTGLFGDEDVLVLFSPGEQAYTVFRTATGEELRHGKLDADMRQPQRVFGRRMQYCTRTANGNRLRIWDPLDDRHVIDLAVPDRVQTQLTEDNELAVVLPPNRICVLDVVSGKVQLDLPFDAQALKNIQSIQAVFSDHERYYLNLTRQSVSTGSAPNISFARDKYVPGVNVRGDLYAVDRKTARILWKRTEPERSYLQTPNVRLPFFIALSTLGGSWNGNSDATVVEIINASTGETIASKDNLTRDYIVQFRYDPAARRVELCGKRTTIHIDFDDRPPAVPDFDRPL